MQPQESKRLLLRRIHVFLYSLIGLLVASSVSFILLLRHADGLAPSERYERYVAVLLVYVVLAVAFYVGYRARVALEVQFEETYRQGERLRAIMDNTSDCVKVLDTDGKLVYLSAGGMREHGFRSPDEIKGWDYFETIEKAYRPRVKACFEAALEGETSSVEVRHVDADVRGRSNRSWCAIAFSPIHGQGGGVDGVLAVSHDISAQKEREAELTGYTERIKDEVRQRTAALEELKEKYREVTENSLIGLYVVQDGKFVYANPAFARIFGYDKPEEIIGRPWQEFTTTKGREAVEASGVDSRLHGSGEEIRYAFEGKRKDGKPIDVEVFSKSTIFRGSALIGSLQDVTERKRAEKKVRELDQLKSRFIQIVSHQFRTPLNAVRWNLEAVLAGDTGKLRVAQSEILRMSHDATVQVIRSFQDLLLALDIEEGRFRLEKSAVDMTGLVDSVVRMSRKDCEMRALRCEEDLAPGVTAEADAEKVRFIIEKLVHNAIAYSPEGKTVTVKLAKENGRVRITVADEGVGIPKEEQKDVFMRFFRASNAAEMMPDASGLGLYIAKYFVEAHEGSIGFRSEEGKGSTFWVELPGTS